MQNSGESLNPACVSENTGLASIAGVGIDLAEVDRIKALIDSYGDVFLEKTFTEDERLYCQKTANPAMHFAARFAAKEAMAKALGTGFDGKITLKSLSVARDALGKPVAVLDAAAHARLETLGAKTMLISLTHTKQTAQALAILSR